MWYCRKITKTYSESIKTCVVKVNTTQDCERKGPGRAYRDFSYKVLIPFLSWILRRYMLPFNMSEVFDFFQRLVFFLLRNI